MAHGGPHHGPRQGSEGPTGKKMELRTGTKFPPVADTRVWRTTRRAVAYNIESLYK